MNTRQTIVIILLILIMGIKIFGMSSNEMIVFTSKVPYTENPYAKYWGTWTFGYWKMCINMAKSYSSGCSNLPTDWATIQLQTARALAIMAIIIMALFIFNSLIPINFFKDKMYNLFVKFFLILFIGFELFVFNLWIKKSILSQNDMLKEYNYKYSYGYSWYLNTISSVLFVLVMFL